MFKPKSQRVKILSKRFKNHIDYLEELFEGNVSMYIDYANVRPWANKLQWNIDLQRLKTFFNSFDNILSVRCYDGILDGDKRSEKEGKRKKKVFKEGFVTKPVKIMRQSIDYTSISPDSKDLLQKFVRSCLLRKYSFETVEFLNKKFEEMNKLGEFYIEDRKCNFDVEISVDMMLDFERGNIDTFVLWSGDSDFYVPIEKLLLAGKKVILFATARKVSYELQTLKEKGLIIFDIKRIREFICWKKQIKS